MARMQQNIRLDGNVGRVGVLTKIGDSVKLDITVRAPGLVKEGTEPNTKYSDKKGFWADVEIWNSLAEQSVKILTPGAKVYVEGTLTVDEYKSTKPESLGHDRQALKVRADHISLKLWGLESVVYAPKKPFTPEELPTEQANEIPADA